VLFTFFVTFDHDIGGWIMRNILIAIVSDSYTTTKLEDPAIYRQERISVVESIHKILLSQNINMLLAESLSFGLLVRIISKFESIATLPREFHDEACVTFSITYNGMHGHLNIVFVVATMEIRTNANRDKVLVCLILS